MTKFTLIYLIGVIIAAIISGILLNAKKKIYVSDLLETIVSTTGSWVFILSIIMKIVITILNFTGKNKLLKKDDNTNKATKQKLIKTK